MSLDSDRGDLVKIVRAHTIPWPQVNEKSIAGAWGVDSIPRVFILTPEGEVFWTGHPARIDEALREVVQKHPSQLPEPVDQTLRDEALALLTQANESLDGGDFAAVLKHAAQVNVEALPDRKVRMAVALLMRKVQVQASDKQEWQAALAADPKSAVAIKKLAEALLAPPPTAAPNAADAADSAAASNPRLVAAKLARAEKAHELEDYYAAWKCYDWLKRLAGDSEAGKAAAARLAEYDADEAISRTIRVQQAEADANATLCLARNYQQAGNLDLAKENYQKLLDEYPDAELACAEARKALQEME
ncbi:MAG: hypothetical protein IT445_07610 [Phycisphaeraceae bacterium]|nr:hypothetical protein [Phycisphaeraceae bacterium]